MEVGLVRLLLLHLDAMLRIPVSIAYAEPIQKIYFLFSSGIPLVLVNIFIVSCMTLLYRKVLVQ